MRSDDDREADAKTAVVTSATREAAALAPATALLTPSTVGWVTPESTLASVHVDFVGNARGPVAARSTVVLDDAALRHAVATRQQAVLVFENGDARLPIVLGLIASAPSPLHALLHAEPLAAPTPTPTPTLKANERCLEANVDGKRVTISAEHEITLTCGDASLTLRRDGKILLRGTYVETNSRGVNRIKGAHVKIN